MLQQRFALLTLLSLSVVILGCTSPTPSANHSGQKISTTKAVRQTGDSTQSELAVLTNSTSATQFVNKMRQWKADESQYTNNAELVSVSLARRSVTLLKENGVTIQVSIDRLSKHDRNFLTQAVHALREDLVTDNQF